MKAVPLKSVATIHRDQRQWSGRPYIGMEDIESGTGRFFGSGDVAGVKSTTFGFTNQHLLYGRLRPYLNKVLLPSFSGHCSTEIMPLLPSSDLDRSYLWYWLTSAPTVAAIDATCTGARMPRANMETVLELQIPLPPLEEQRRIVAVLDQAFAAIATATANAEKNLANARELFEACSAKLFSSNGPDWQTLVLGEISDFQGGSQPPKSNFISEPRSGFVRLLQIRDFKSDKAAVYIPESKRNKLCKIDDVMLARYGASVGQIHRGKAGAYNVALIRTIPNIKMVNKDYFYYYLKSPLFQIPLIAVASRSAQDGFGKDDIVGIEVPVPPLAAQLQLTAELMAIDEECKSLASLYKSKIEAMKAFKQSLLHRAFTGELTATVLETEAA